MALTTLCQLHLTDNFHFEIFDLEIHNSKNGKANSKNFLGRCIFFPPKGINPLKICDAMQSLVYFALPFPNVTYLAYAEG